MLKPREDSHFVVWRHISRTHFILGSVLSSIALCGCTYIGLLEPIGIIRAADGSMPQKLFVRPMSSEPIMPVSELFRRYGGSYGMDVNVLGAEIAGLTFYTTGIVFSGHDWQRPDRFSLPIILTNNCGEPISVSADSFQLSDYRNQAVDKIEVAIAWRVINSDGTEMDVESGQTLTLDQGKSLLASLSFECDGRIKAAVLDIIAKKPTSGSENPVRIAFGEKSSLPRVLKKQLVNPDKSSIRRHVDQ
jgi:hypothetical protein